ncbi:MAG: hypothetical protein ACI9JN_002202 [Bacteroidia bacterium]|jgi:hypothetical protein
MKHLIMFCPEFPPVNSTGSYRSASFARELKQLGIEPIVFSLPIHVGQQHFKRNIDVNLLRGLEDIVIHRIEASIIPGSKSFFARILNWLKISDNVSSYIDKKKLYDLTEEMVSRYQVRDIYISLPPFSISDIAIGLSNQFGLRLITDFRDGWSTWGAGPFKSIYHFLNIKQKEKKLIKNSSHVLTVTDELSQDILRQHQTFPQSKLSVIYNGLDDIYFNNFVVEHVINDNALVKVGYVGSFYYYPELEKEQNKPWAMRSFSSKIKYWHRKEEWIYRSPYFFLKVISAYHTKYPDSIKFQFEYVGNMPTWLNEMINEFDLTDLFVNHGFRDKEETLGIMNTWNAILATSENIPDGKHFCLPSKSFDNVVTGKNIFAFITSGAQEQFYRHFKQVTYFNPSNTQQNLELLRNYVINKNDHFLEQNIFPKKYTRKYQAKQLYKQLS